MLLHDFEKLDHVKWAHYFFETLSLLKDVDQIKPWSLNYATEFTTQLFESFPEITPQDDGAKEKLKKLAYQFILTVNSKF